MAKGHERGIEPKDKEEALKYVTDLAKARNYVDALFTVDLPFFT